jgi:hypothetical protein
MAQLLRLAVLSALFALVQAQKTVSQRFNPFFTVFISADTLTGIDRRVMEPGLLPGTTQKSTFQSLGSHSMEFRELFTGSVSSTLPPSTST